MTDEGTAEFDEAFFTEHFNVYHETFVDQYHTAIPHMLEKCPVVHSDALAQFWVVSQYEDVVSSFQDWRHLSSALEKALAGTRPGQPVKPPIDLDPPLQRRFRQLLNPYLTPDRVAKFEPWIRDLVTRLIDDFIEEGHVDLAGRFTRQLPGRMLFRLLFGIEDDDVPTVDGWLRVILYQPKGPDTPELERKWIAWIYEVIERRRNGPRHDDLIDALIHGDIEGEPIPDELIMGTMNVLIQGGFGTTADAIGTIIKHLAQHPEMQIRLRAYPEAIPLAIEEFLRFEPSVAGMSRLCVADTTIHDVEVAAGERLFLSIAAANRDPREFEDPSMIDLDRTPNRHLSFGIGPHRCIGSNVARANLRIAIEELLSRLHDIRLTEGDRVRQDPSSAWGPAYLPITFTPGRPVMSGEHRS
jgi:cytochrome P450